MTVIHVKFGRPREDEPEEPELIDNIIFLRDQQCLTWREIGYHLGMSHQGPYLLYRRWRDWYYQSEYYQPD
jgi:hypothetical protein